MFFCLYFLYFLFFSFFNFFLVFLSFKSQRYAFILSLITQTEVCVCLIRIIYNFMHQIRVVNYNSEAMSLIKFCVQ